MGDAKRRRERLGDEAYFAGDPRWKYGFRKQERLPSADAWIAMHTATCPRIQASLTKVVTPEGHRVNLSGFDDQSHSTVATAPGSRVGFPTSGRTRTITCRACGVSARVRP